MIRRLSRETLLEAYEEEKNANVSRRMLLVLKVRVEVMKQAHAAKELCRDRSWATIWLKCFDEDGHQEREVLLPKVR